MATEEPILRTLHWDEDLRTGAVTWAAGVSVFLEQELPPSSRAWWERRVHPDDLRALQSETDAIRKGTREQWNGEYRVRAGDAWRRIREQMVLVEADGAAVRIVGTIRDATPAPSLPDSERRFATLLDQLPLLVWEADADGWIDFYNQRWFTYTGTTLEQMQGWGVGARSRSR